jgi:hypothetical protein
MQFRREQKANADFIHTLSNLLRRQFEIDPQFRQHVGAAALTGRRSVAVLGDGYVRARRDKRHSRADIECS